MDGARKMKQSKFQFLNPSLEELYFVVNSELAADEVESEIQNNFHVQVRRSQNENRANVGLILETNMEMDKVPFKLRIKMVSDFKWEDLDEHQVENMLKLNAPALLLSYMRPIVASITNSANFPPYNLPFINFKE